MNGTAPSRLWLVSVLALAASLSASPASAQDALPPFTGESLTVTRQIPGFDKVKEAYDKLNADSKQKYYAIVIRNSGSGNWATRDYVDRLYEAWKEQAAKKNLTLDPDRSVLILLAIENRSLSIHPGAVLQAQYGLQGATVDRELVQPHFIPWAKSQNPAEGLINLAQETEKWIKAKDATKAQAKADTAARAARLKRTAKTSLEDARKLAAEVRKELVARELTLTPMAEELRVAEDKLTETEGLPELNPQAAMALVERIRKELVEMQLSLRQMVADEHNTAEQLAKNETAIVQVETALEERIRAEMTVAPIQAKLEDAREKMKKSRERVKLDPRVAIKLADQAAKAIKEAREETADLPKLRGEVNVRAKSAQYEVDRIEVLLKDAVRAGGAAKEAETFKELQSLVATAKELEAKDYQAAVETYDKAVEKLRAQGRRLDSARASRVFTTRTLPISAVSLLMAGGAGFYGWKVRRHVGLKRKAEAELAKFQAEGVDLLDKLDALKKRHQMLPFSDRDYSEAMTGATLASYQACEEALSKVRETWLAIMEIRREVEGLVATAPFLKNEKLEKALKIMAETPQAVGAQEQYARIVEHLNLLENAHETAAPLLKAADAARDGLVTQLEQLRSASLATAPYEPELSACAALADTARQSLVPDPIGAKRTLDEALARHKTLADLVGRVVARWSEAQAVIDKLRNAHERTKEERAGGLLLTEERANPDHSLVLAGEEHTAAVASLQKADPETAARHIAAADTAVADAVGRIDAQHVARDFAGQAVPARREGLERLVQHAGQAAEAREELARDFAEPSWHDVAESAAYAQEIARDLGPRIDRAEQQRAAQHYLAAADLLRQIENDEQQANTLAASVLARRTQLDDLRSKARAEQTRLASEAERVRGFLAANERIASAEADRALVAAEKLMDQAGEQSRIKQPHWPAIAERQQQSSAGLVAAEQRAKQDIQAHADLSRRLPTVAQQGQRVGELLRSSTADRPRANERYHAANIAFSKVNEQARSAKADWPQLLKQLAEIAADFEKADALAREDIRLAQQARDALAEAEREVQRAKSFYRSGISAETSTAEAQLAQARRELAAQDYEQAITLGGSSERAARDAHHDAERTAQAKEERQEAQRRQRLAQQALAAAAMAAASRPSSSYGMSSSSGGSWSSGGSSSPSSSSSSGSYSSGSSQSSW